METVANNMFKRAKKLGLMGRQEEAKEQALAAIDRLKRSLGKSSGSKQVHEELFKVYFFIEDKESAREHLANYIASEKKSIAELCKDEEIKFHGCRFRQGYLKGKEHWLHLLSTGGLSDYFQNITHKPGIWAFDLDGTILEMDGYSWDIINKKLGTEALDSEFFKLYKSGRISHETWADLNLRLYRDMGMNKRLFEQIFSAVHFYEGVVETLQAIKNPGDKKLALVSGSFENLIWHTIPIELFDERHINRLFFDCNGVLEDWELTPYGDGNGKAEALHKLRTKKGNSPKRFVAYVGDNDNDIEAFAKADLSIAFNPKTDRIRRAADIVIEDDMRKILKYL